MPLSFDPGEAYQFDWSHEVLVIAGVTTTVKVAHVRLCHNRIDPALFEACFTAWAVVLRCDARDLIALEL